MAINVRLKDASGNVLHPETDWSLVQNKPSFEMDGGSESWSAGDRLIFIESDEGVYIRSNDGIRVRDANTNNEDIFLTDYPVNWNAINNKPSITTDSSGESWSVSTIGKTLSLSGIKGVSLGSGMGTVDINGISGVNLSAYSGTVTLHAGGSNKFIQVADANTGNKDTPLYNYPIKFSKLSGVSNFVCFGTIEDDDNTLYPAVAVMILSDGSATVNNGVYLSTSGNWIKFDGSASKPSIGSFTPFIS